MAEVLVINEHYANTRSLNGIAPLSFEFEIKSKYKRMPGFNPDRKFLLANSSSLDDCKFSHSGIITEVLPPKVIPFNDLEMRKNAILIQSGKSGLRPNYMHLVKAKPTKKVGEINKLSDFAYSLLIVNKFSKPISHFQQQWRTISEVDLESILEGWVYITRTAFGKLGNSLPKENRLEFTILAIQYFKDDTLRGINYFDALKLLYDYIESRILSKGRLLISTDDRLQNLFPKPEIHKNIGFLKNEESEIDTVHSQAALFRDLFSSEGIKFIEFILSEVKKHKNSEERFQNLFKNSRWPLILGDRE